MKVLTEIPFINNPNLRHGAIPEQFSVISEQNRSALAIYFPHSSIHPPQSRFRAISEPFQSSFRAVSMELPSNCPIVTVQYQFSFRAIPEPFQSSFRAVSEQFRSSLSSVSEQFRSSFRAILELFQSNSGAVSEQEVESRQIPAKISQSCK